MGFYHDKLRSTAEVGLYPGCPLYEMGRRKILGIIAVVGLTLLNIWMAKFVIKPLKAKRLMQEQKTRKNLDTLVIPIDNIHPAKHLEDAAQIEESRRVSNQGNSQSHQEPPLPVMTGTRNQNGPLLGSQDNSLNRQNWTPSPPFLYKPIIYQEEVKSQVAPNTDFASLDSLDTTDLENIKLGLQALRENLKKREKNGNSMNQPGMQQPNVKQGVPNQVDPFIPQQNNNAPMPRNPWDPNPTPPNPAPNPPNTNEGEMVYPKGAFILDSIKNNLSPPALAAQTTSPYVKEVVNKLSDIFNNPNLSTLLKSNDQVLQGLLQKLLQIRQQQQQQRAQVQNQPMPEEGIPQLPDAEIPTPDNKAVFEKMLQNIASDNMVEKGTDERRLFDQISKDLQNPSSNIFQSMNGPVKSETFINRINPGQETNLGGKDL